MAALPHRVLLRRTKGWRMPPNTVKVDRSTRYGNPFRVGDPGVPDVRASIERFKCAMRNGELIRDDPDSRASVTRTKSIFSPPLQGESWVGLGLR